MQRVGDSTSTANGAGEFTQGQPGSGVDATMITVAWLNTVQRELVNLVVGSGQELEPTDDAQVFKAVKALQELASTWEKIADKPTTISGFGITDAFTKSETTGAIQDAVDDLVGLSPADLDTLEKLAGAVGNDPGFAEAVTDELAKKAAKATTLSGYGISPASQADAEADGDFDNTRPSTMLRVYQFFAKRMVQATELAFGWAKVASQGLVNAGIDDTTMVTPKKMRFGFSILLAPNGYIVLPSWLGGFVAQWFSGANMSAGANSSAQQVVPFPIEFPNAVLGGGVWAKYVSGVSPSISEFVAPTKTQVTVILVNSFTANTSGAAPRGFYFGY